MKLCTVIAYYNTSITRQLKFLNSHCSIVCGYCSVLCLTAKSIVKMIKFLSSFKLKEIHRVDSPFNEDPKNIFFCQGGPNFGGGMARKVREMGNNRGIYCFANWGVVNFERAYQPLPPGTKVLFSVASVFLHARPIFRKNEKEPKFDPFLGSFPPKI